MGYAVQDLKDTNKLFKVVERVIREMWDNVSVIHSCETHETELDKYLDCSKGIDCIVRFKDGKYLPLSLRVQDGVNFKSFSVRFSRDTNSPTEFSKRSEEVKTQDPFRPSGLLQIYLGSDRNTLLGAGYATWADLLNYIELHTDKETITATDRDYSTQQFIACYWQHMKKVGYKVKILMKDIQ